MVTGGTGAIGQAIVQKLANDQGSHVILIARNPEKAKRTTDSIIKATGNQNISYHIADVSRKDEIFTLADNFKRHIDVLINNAAAAPKKRTETPKGIEMQFATNVLGYFWMSQAFLPHLKKSNDPRIINVASYWAGDLNLDDLEFERRRYSNGKAYRQSKQADRMLTVEFARRYKEYGITVNSCHPGDVNSTLSNDLGFGGFESAMQGAETPVLLATSSLGREHTGKYFANGQVVHDQYAQMDWEIKKLFEICESY